MYYKVEYTAIIENDLLLVGCDYVEADNASSAIELTRNRLVERYHNAGYNAHIDNAIVIVENVIGNKMIMKGFKAFKKFHDEWTESEE